MHLYAYAIFKILLLHVMRIKIQYFNFCFSLRIRLAFDLDGPDISLDFPDVFQGYAWQLANQTFQNLTAQDRNSSF